MVVINQRSFTKSDVSGLQRKFLQTASTELNGLRNQSYCFVPRQLVFGCDNCRY
jgi:hypothetical protein